MTTQTRIKLPNTDPNALNLIRSKASAIRPEQVWGRQLPNRALSLPKEGILNVNAKVGWLRERGFDICNFCIGQPDFDTPEHVKEKMKWAIDTGKNGYTPSAGIFEAREAAAHYISETRGIKASPENICIFHGGKPTIAAAIFCAAKPGSEIIYPVPGFPTYGAQIGIQRAKGVPIHLKPENGFQMDMSEFRKKVGNKTSLVILCSPNNPTGVMQNAENLKEIAGLAQKWGFRVYSDEVYSQITYEKEFMSIASLNGMFNGTVIAESGSKLVAAPAYRIGFVASGDLALMQAIKDYAMNTDSCPNITSQYGVVAAFRGPMDATKMMVESYRRRRDIIVPLLNGIGGFDCKSPDGAFYAYVDVTKAIARLGLKNAEALETLLLENGVAVLADNRFGPKEKGDLTSCIRLSFAVAEETIRKGVERIKCVIEGRQILA
ncbi:MAG: aminotransferase class I/II-fold pyridoxal phosphate-dependent enzyme [Candidatus Micrarchaeia archaeon]